MVSNNRIVNESDFLWKITGKLHTEISKEELWGIISAPKNLELFHPFCEKNKILKWPGKGSLDEIYYYSGLVYQRNFINWVDDYGYDLLIGEKGKDQSLVSWRIRNDNNAVLTITIRPHKFNKGSLIYNIIPYNILVKPLLQRYIDSVMLGLNYYIEKRIKVKKNHFGAMRFFSY